MFVAGLLAAQISADVNRLPVVREPRARVRQDLAASFRWQCDPPQQRSRRADCDKKARLAVGDPTAQEDQIIVRADRGAEQNTAVGVVPALGAVGIDSMKGREIPAIVDDAIGTDVRCAEGVGRKVVIRESPQSITPGVECFQAKALRRVKSVRVDGSVGADGGLRVAKKSGYGTRVGECRGAISCIPWR